MRALAQQRAGLVMQKIGVEISLVATVPANQGR
jgi:hypothetical protein